MCHDGSGDGRMGAHRRADGANSHIGADGRSPRQFFVLVSLK